MKSQSNPNSVNAVRAFMTFKMFMTCIAAMATMALTPIALAQGRGTSDDPQVEITYPQPRAEVGEPILLSIDVTDAAEAGTPTVPEVKGLRVDVRRPSLRSMSINGRQWVSVRYDILFLAEQAGKYVIPRVRIVVDGKTYESREATVEVTASDTSRLARAVLSIDPETAVVGQSVTAHLEIWLRSPRSGRGRLDAETLWSQTILPNESKWGIFQSAIEELYRERRFRFPPRVERDAEGAEWFVYELAAPTAPDRPGPMHIPGIEVRLHYARADGRDRLITIEPEQPVSVIDPPPADGRPADFTGAIGEFEIEAKARPTRASVGDPITLSISIVDRTPGGADLAHLLPPPVGEQPDFQRSFRIPSEPLVGSINGRIKTFTQTLRALSERVTEIPPVSFSFYDPREARYRTVTTQPIPLTILPVERIDTVAVTGGAGGSGVLDAPASKLTEVEGGLVASVPVSPALLDVSRVDPGWTTAALVALPPLLAGAALVFRRRADRFGSDERIVRARRAPAKARRAIANAGDPPALAAALREYLADRSGRAAASLTRTEALALVAASGAEDSLHARVDQVLSAGERAAYAQRGAASIDALRNEARHALAELEGLDLDAGAGVRT